MVARARIRRSADVNVPVWLWFATIAGLLAVFGLDLFVVDRAPHRVTMAEATRWVVGYVSGAVVFGLLVWAFAGSRYAGEFFSGYITEYSLSVDNLFVFLVIMTAFAVPVIHQHRVLLVGILIALVLRTALILAGAALISRFIAVFYVFGAFLIYTAYRLVRTSPTDGETEYVENAALRLLRRIVPVTRKYHGSRSFVRVDGRRTVTPMLVVIIAIGTTDLLFALDSIPAVFGLTREGYLVFAVNAFALMGLRQLYFLLGDLLRRLVYLRFGLSVLLLFIGGKLILEALREDWQPFKTGRQSIQVPVPGPGLSLIVVVGVLVVTVVASLIRMRRRS
jgi:tellurite resistance protein TerC